MHLAPEPQATRVTNLFRRQKLPTTPSAAAEDLDANSRKSLQLIYR